MKKLTLLLPLLLISLTYESNAQLDDLSYVSNLIDQAPKTGNQVETELESPIEEKTIDRPDRLDEYKDQSYGYTGGESFINPPQSKFPSETLEYFGYSFFTDPPSTYSSLKDTPIPPDYLIGPNDNIKIILYGDTNYSYELKVTRDGDIFLPGIGPLNVAGISFEDLQELVNTTVNNRLIGTQVSVTLGSLRAINVFILGEAKQPGMYTISALSSLTNAIIKSGGINTSGSLRNIQLKRKGEIIATFDFYDLLLLGDTSNDMRLMQGDVILIPPIQKTVGISGEILRPGIYELKESDELYDLISFAGRLKPKANQSSAEIKRIDQTTNGFKLIAIDLSRSIESNIELKDGDTFSIYPVIDNLQNAILISGHAQQPGFYPWKIGMRISDIFKSPDNLLGNTDMNYVLIKRKLSETQSYEFLQVDLDDLFKNENSTQHQELLEKDEIILFPSLLNPALITTSIIQDQDIYDQENQFITLQDQRTSLTYLKKSLLTEEAAKEKDGIPPVVGVPNISDDDKNKRFYEYSIYNYCVVPKKLAMLVLETELLPKTKNLNQKLTSSCREQLLDPIISLVNRQTNLSNITQSVSIHGNVHFPGEYPLTKNMTLGTAIQAAGGYKSSTYEVEVEVISSNKTDKKFNVSTSSASINNAYSIPIKALDIINLKQVQTNISTIQISGEVYFPGVYPIQGKQTLRELIQRAGGIKDQASLEGTRFQRQTLRENDIQQLKFAQEELSRKAILSAQSNTLGQDKVANEQILNLTKALSDTEINSDNLGRLVIDLQSILSGTTNDILLEDGDSIFIPKERQTISVLGEVYVKNTHIFDQNLNISEYINLSGGVTEYADQNSIYIIKASGSIIPSSAISNGFFRANSNLDPGDTIVVPINIQPFSAIQATTEVSQILYQMALAAAAINSF